MRAGQSSGDRVETAGRCGIVRQEAHVRSSWIVASVLVGSTTVMAQSPDMDDRSFLQAALTVMFFYTYTARCTTLGPKDAATVDEWQRTNGAALIRQRLRALEGAASAAAKVAAARASVQQQVRSMQVAPCDAVLGLTRAPDAQIAAKAPAMLKALQAVAEPPPQTPRAAVQPSTDAATAASLGAPARQGILGDIEAFGFDSAMTAGVGGFLTTRIYPVVLFRDGSALTDVAGLASPGGIAQHRREHPKAWAQWRREGSEIQLLKGGTWSKLPFRNTYPSLPNGFRLDGFFRSLGGAGTVAIGGTQSVAAWSEYQFWPDGRIQRGGGAGAQAADAGGSVVATAAEPNRRGQYRIDGLELVVRWDDGRDERRILITDPADPKAAIWLDGVGYARRAAR